MEVQKLGVAIKLQRNVVYGHILALPVRPKNRGAQFDPYLRMNQLHQIRGRLATAELQITPGVFRQMHDIVRGVNHD